MDIGKIYELLRGRTVTTASAFSGSDAPAAGADIFEKTLEAWFRKRGTTDVDSCEFDPLFGVELMDKSQEVLLAQKPRCRHLFGDVLSFLPRSLKLQADEVREVGGCPPELRDKILLCATKMSAWCSACGRECSVCTSEQHVAGL